MLRYIVVVLVVLFIAIYGFKIHLPTSTGTLEIYSGFVSNAER